MEMLCVLCMLMIVNDKCLIVYMWKLCLFVIV